MRSVYLFSAVIGLTMLAVVACQPMPLRQPPNQDQLAAYAQRVAQAPTRVTLYPTQEAADEGSRGCLSCHTQTDSRTMHELDDFAIGCIDCHGGDASVLKPTQMPDERPYGEDYLALMKQAHIAPRYPTAWENPETGLYSSANPQRTYALLNFEDPAFIQFINPGDLRIADRTCGKCHFEIVDKVRKSMMAHGAQLWAAVMYNNGSYPYKLARFGESYSPEGVPQRIYTTPPATDEERARGVIDYLDPLPRWEITQMGNILRSFERGGKVQRLELEVGLPNPLEEPGKPDMKLSDRGLGTQLATDQVFLGIQKTRLLDPLLYFMGTNDHPGDYRHSGCTSCHVVYANDRSPVHAGAFGKFGNTGKSQTIDPTIDKTESGHPIKHQFTRSVPSSQCVVCHVHPGTSFANTYFGFMWWDNETHGELMYPKEQQYPTAEQYVNSLMSNPEASSVRGLWSDLWPGEKDHEDQAATESFLANLTDLNSKMDKTQFADFHGHGWVFRAVFKQDRKGRLLDNEGDVVAPVTPKMLQEAVAFRSTQEQIEPPAGHPVHLKDIHLERGMHCVDCHFEQDVHGDGKLYSEVRNAIEIDCIDCHGTIAWRTTLKTSGPAGGNDLRTSKTAYGMRFQWVNEKLYQQSSLDAQVRWEVPQLRDIVDPSSDRYNAKAAYAKTLQKGGSRWGDPSCPESQLAHDNSNMTCYACHTSWMTSCFGCHLPMRSNFRMPMLHNEGEILRNFTTYNYQVLRDDVFMLGRDSTVKGKKIAPVRSSSAVIVGSANANREWLYSQQQTISAEGYSGQAFNPHFPHAVRKRESRQCMDCHLSKDDDNNAWMAQVLLHGTNLVNFMGRYIYVATGEDGLEAVVVTEREEPQAVIGSDLHALAYPDEYAKHKARHHELKEAYHHGLKDGWYGEPGRIVDLQLRGEYLYTAREEGGFYAYDVANIDNKGFSERITSAPVSPLGQRLGVKTRFATAIASPTTLGVDPTRPRLSSDPTKPRAIMLEEPQPHHVNQEQRVHPIYAFLYVTDLYEGLVVIGDPHVGTLLDGDPTNNFLKRGVAFNPDGKLDGAVHLTLAGTHAYICCKRGLVVVDIANPAKPNIVGEVGREYIVDPRAVAIQFRYAFVTDSQGLKVVDITFPDRPRAITEAVVELENAHRLYVARTYAFVAGGKQGLAIIDIEKPESPRLEQLFDADGQMNDVHDVKVGMTNNSVFAYVADGHNGLRVLQLTSPRSTKGFGGFIPQLVPRLIATYHTHGPALAISKGLDRDRAVDESGHQLAVFGRIGSRPFTLEEQQRMYLRDGQVYKVDNEVPAAQTDYVQRKRTD